VPRGGGGRLIAVDVVAGVGGSQAVLSYGGTESKGSFRSVGGHGLGIQRADEWVCL
jgi:hypothetical protein